MIYKNKKKLCVGFFTVGAIPFPSYKHILPYIYVARLIAKYNFRENIFTRNLKKPPKTAIFRQIIRFFEPC